MESEGTPQFKSIKRSLCLPEEIVEEILSRLPVKSLLRFRCVSKPWRDLIGSEHFIKKHLHTSTENPNFTHHSIILNSIEPQLGLKQCSLISMLSDPFIDQFTFCDLENIGRESICIVGCCNGLVCLLIDGKHFMLWNPSTRKAKQLPAFDHFNEDGYMTSEGFGYDDLSGDYMVFGIASLFYSSGRYETINKVYSLQRNSWKVVKRGNIVPCYDEGNCASGKLHWSMYTGMGWDIVSFDLRSEVYDVVELPCCSKEFDCIPVGVLGGRLSLLCDCLSHLDVWILKEYGVKESWEKVATLPCLHTTVRSPYEFLLATGPDGEILLTGESSFGIYYPEGDGFRQCRVRGLGVFHEAVVCVESLVLL